MPTRSIAAVNRTVTAGLVLLFATVFGNAQTVVNIPASSAGGTGAQIVSAAYSMLSAGAGGTINIGPGTYYLTQSIVMGSNMTVNGSGSTTILQLPSSPNGIAAFTSYGGANMTIQNLVMDGGIPQGAFLVCCGGQGNPYSSTGVNMYSTNSSEVNVYLTNLEIRNFELGLFLGTVNGLYITNLNMHDNNPGSYAHNAYLVSCDNVTISHSRFDAAHTGDGLHIDFGGANTTIVKSEFSENRGYGILSQENVNVTMSGTRTDFNTNDGIQVDAAGLNLDTNEGSYNGAYGFDIPDTLDGNGHLNGYWGYGNGADIGYFYESSIANITGNGYPVTANLYEAEQADGVLGPIDTADWTTAYSGFSGVGAVDFNANHIPNGSLSFSHVGAVSAGNYSMTLRYSNGTDATQTMSLTVNGVTQTALSFPTTNNDSTWSTVNFIVPLNSGNNVVVIGVQGTAAPEIDYLQVNTATPSAPATPTGLTANPVTPYSVNVSWQPVAGASTYNVYQDGRVEAVNLVGTTFTDNRILFGNSGVYYQVQAVNQGGSSGLSSPVSTTTPIDSPAGFQGPSVGTGPGNYFIWMSSNGASSYNLKRSNVSGGPYTTAAQITNTTSLQSSNFYQSGEDATAVPGTTYFYVVTSVDSNGNESSTHTYEIAATTPYPSFTLAASPSSLTLAWGQSISTSLLISPSAGFSGAVNLSITGLPAGVTATLGAPTGLTYPLTLTASSTAALGTVNVTINAVSVAGTPSASTAVSLTVASQIITFNPIPPQVVGTSLTVSASASSGLPITFSVVQNGNCTVSGNVVTFTNTGNCGVLANQAGNGTYGPAPQVGQIVVVNGSPSGQTITFPTIATQNAGTSLALVATATSALPVTFASSTSNVCTVSGTTATFVGGGTCTIVASQTGDASYNAATPVSQSFTVNVVFLSQTITFSAIGTQTIGTPLTLSATATSGLAVSFASSTTGVCTVSGTTASFVAAGTCTIVASQSGNNTYAAANPVSQNFVVNPLSQTITFNAIPAQIVGTTLTVSATASSGLPVTFTVVQNGNCSVSGSMVTFLNTGNCGVIANQSGNTAYAAAPTVGQVIVVNSPTAQTITFNPIATQTVGTPLTLSATATSGLPVSFASATTSVCTVSGTTVSFLASGTCTIVASQAGSSTYAAAPTVSQSFAINAAPLKSQTITFNAIPAQVVGTILTVSATASSGLPVSFTVVQNGNCSVSGAVVTFLNTGNCGVIANQLGNTTYAAAPAVGQVIVVNNPTAQTISFNAIAAQTVGTPITLSATASSGLTVSFASTTSGVCTVSGTTASFVAAGTCTIVASQAGNSTYSAAPSISHTFTVNAALKAQTITFNTIAAQTVGTTLTVSATATSGLPVTFTIVPNGNCSISGSVVTFLNTGDCGVIANQAGNTTYAAAPSVGQVIVVNAAPSFTLSISAASLSLTPGQSGTDAITVKPANGFNSSVTFSVSGLPTGVSDTLSVGSSTTGSTLTIKSAPSTKAGTYTITVKGTAGSLTASATLSLLIK
jgi:hypothetical protein